MQIEYDESKSRKNQLERGLPFSLVSEFDFETAYIWRDNRRNYGEIRYQAIGFMGERLYALAFCYRTKLRVISFRKANNREVRKYEQYTATQNYNG